MAGAVRGDDTELGDMAVQRVEAQSALADHLVAHTLPAATKPVLNDAVIDIESR